MGYELMWEPEGLRIRFHGAVTDEDLLRVNTERYADPRFGASIRYQLMDALDVTEVTAKTETVRMCARSDLEMSKRFPDLGVALVVNRVALYGLARLYQLQVGSSPWETQVFPDLPAARAWLAQRERPSAAS